MNSPNLTETLANLSINIIMGFVIVATCIRLGFIRLRSGWARSAAELLESAIIAVVLVFLVIRPFVVQAYFIPSPSMEPTLLGKNGVGDRILVNKLVYRVSKPQRDDVVVFIPPAAATEGSSEDPSGNPVNFIKRLIGLPGDIIEAHAGKLIVNGQAFSHAKVRQVLADAGVFGDDGLTDPDLQADHHVKFVDGGILIDGKPFSTTKMAQILTNDPNAKLTIVPGYTTRNGKKLVEPFTAEDPDYDLKLWHGQPLKYDQSQGPRLNGSPIIQKEYDIDVAAPAEPVPPGEFFMMGDNRNDSKDSTEWGPLEKNRVVGKAEYIFWPLNRIGAIPQK